MAMSKVGHGQLHDADSADKFPAILAHELDGLQKITAQNVRLRVEPKLFCHAWAQYGDYPTIQLPDGRVELALGDLVSEESRDFVLLTEVLPLPLLPGGKLPASLEGEELLGLEFVWTEIADTEIKSCQSPAPGSDPGDAKSGGGRPEPGSHRGRRQSNCRESSSRSRREGSKWRL